VGGNATIPELVVHSRQTALHALVASPVESLDQGRSHQYQGAIGYERIYLPPIKSQASRLQPCHQTLYGSFAVAPYLTSRGRRSRAAASTVPSSDLSSHHAAPAAESSRNGLVGGGIPPQGRSDTGFANFTFR
jgi:hypothetical protein